MQWTDDQQIHIHTILHQNKNDEHARGHIGTELNNKAETVMQIEVDKNDTTISIVSVIHIRDKEFQPFAFHINQEALPELVESYTPKRRESAVLRKSLLTPIGIFRKMFIIALRSLRLLMAKSTVIMNSKKHCKIVIPKLAIRFPRVKLLQLLAFFRREG